MEYFHCHVIAELLPSLGTLFRMQNIQLVVMCVIDGSSLTQSVIATDKTASSSSSSSSSPLMHIEGLLEALTVADKDGRIVVNRQGESLSLVVF